MAFDALFGAIAKMNLNDFRNVAVIVACIVAILTLWHHIRNARIASRQSTWITLFDDFRQINNYISTHKGDDLVLPYPEFTTGQTTGMLIFHHLNLLFRYYISRPLLKRNEKKGFERWIQNVLFTWLTSDPKIAKDVTTIIEHKDLYPDDFLTWFNSRPGYDVVLRKANQ